MTHFRVIPIESSLSDQVRTSLDHRNTGTQRMSNSPQAPARAAPVCASFVPAKSSAFCLPIIPSKGSKPILRPARYLSTRKSASHLQTPQNFRLSCAHCHSHWKAMEKTAGSLPANVLQTQNWKPPSHACLLLRQCSTSTSAIPKRDAILPGLNAVIFKPEGLR